MRLLARPAQVVHASVDHEAAGAPGLVAEHAVAGELVGIQAELVGQALGIQSPTLDEGIRQPARAQATKRRQVRASPGLERPAGGGRARPRGTRAPAGCASAARGLKRVDVEGAWPRAVFRTLEVEGGRRVALAVFLDLPDHHAHGWQSTEGARQRCLRRRPPVAQRIRRSLHAFVGRFAGITGQLLGEGSNRASHRRHGRG